VRDVQPGPWTRRFWRCTGTRFLAAAARCGASSNITTSLSKKSLHAAEQERADVARARQRWMREQGMFDPAHLGFVDETAANTKMVRLNGRCPRGERLIGRVPLAQGGGTNNSSPAPPNWNIRRHSNRTRILQLFQARRL